MKQRIQGKTGNLKKAITENEKRLNIIRLRKAFVMALKEIKSLNLGNK